MENGASGNLLSAHRKSIAKPARNSSIELLRIIAMIGIVAHHFVYFNSFDVSSQQLSFNKFFLVGVCEQLGKISVVMFFTISAWFLSEHQSGMRSSFKRVWILEREVLFWSLVSLGVAAAVGYPLSAKDLIRSLMPTVTSQWWYVTAYILFSLIYPFLTKGLRALGRRNHAILCIITLVVWGVVAGLLPTVTMGMSDSVFLLIYIYVIVSYWNWYMNGIGWKTGLTILAIGFLVLFAVFLVFALLFDRFSSEIFMQAQTFLSSKASGIISLAIGFGAFAVFKHVEFHNKIVNYLAQCMFGVYLLTEYPAFRSILWEHIFSLNGLYNSPLVVPICIVQVLVIVAICALLDSIRIALFRVTIDRRKGQWFEKAANRARPILERLTVDELKNKIEQ